ncbi:unannotated protein [freshwater metagenome]|uniref:Unannotated protein n=1 Tax=freshwater metagenome TaxID=449393 RepID=A0A6J7E6L8_9ZZZZ
MRYGSFQLNASIIGAMRTTRVVNVDQRTRFVELA